MSTLPRPDLREGVARLLRLTRKELSESLRDRRTILTLLLMPLLLYPVLAMAFLQMSAYSRVEKQWPVFTVGVVSKEEGDAIVGYWQEIGQEVRLHRHTPPGQSPNRKDPPAYLAPVPRLMQVVTPDLEAAVRTGEVDVGVRLKPAGPFRANARRLLSNPLAIDCELLYRDDVARSRDAARYLEQLTADANIGLLGAALWHRGVTQRSDPVRLRAVAVFDDSGKRSSLVLVPLILILMTMTGAVYPAIDLTAGERERGTLEILVAAPIPRMSVLLAKYAAVFTVAMLTAIVNIGSMTVTLTATGIAAELFAGSFTFGVMLQVLALLALFAAFFSAVLLAVTSFARSFKEAQSYLIPLVLFCLMPGVLALMPGLSLRGPLAVVPLVNIVLLARDLFAGSASFGLAFVVIISTLVYAVAAVALAARIFGTEAVLTGDQGTWGDLFRRPSHARAAAEPAAALLILAVLFPVYFLIVMSLAQLPVLGMPARLALSAVVTTVLFGGFPLVSAWLGRVRLVSALRLHPASPAAWLAALLLGLCVWPFAHELLLLLRQMGFTALSEEHLKTSQAMLEQWRGVSPVLVVLAMAVTPAVFEELFFRGYLFSALLGENAHPVRAIVGSAALFAVFHLLVGGVLMIERLVPSLLLGLVLGWLAYRSGSVLPGMLLHVVHNGLLVLMGYYQPVLIEQGWMPKADDHLPAWLLAAAGAGVAGGLVWLWRLQRPARKSDT